MKAAWEWAKKYWEVLLGALLVLLGFAFGVSIARRKATPVLPNPVKEEAEKAAAEETRKAEQKTADAKAEAVKAAEEKKTANLEELTKKTEAVRDSAQETNEYLKSVGNLVRGDEP